MGGSSPGPVDFGPQFQGLRDALSFALTQQVGSPQPTFPGQLFTGTAPASQGGFDLINALLNNQPELAGTTPLPIPTPIGIGPSESTSTTDTTTAPTTQPAHPDSAQLVQQMVDHGWSPEIAERVAGEMLDGTLTITQDASGQNTFALGSGNPTSAQDVFNTLSSAGSVSADATFTSSNTSNEVVQQASLQALESPTAAASPSIDPVLEGGFVPSSNLVGQTFGAGGPFVPPGFSTPGPSGVQPLVNVAQGIGNQNTLVSQLLQQLGRSIPEQFGSNAARSLGTQSLLGFNDQFQNQIRPNINRALTSLGPTTALAQGPGGIFERGAQTLEGILGTGNPVTIGPSFESGKALIEQNLDDQIAQISESFGARGNRFSQPLANAIGETRRRGALDINNLLATFTRESGENAANRQATGVTQAADLGGAATTAGTGVSSSILNAANLFGEQAQFGAQLPLDVAGAIEPFEARNVQAPQDRARTVSEVGTQIPQAAGDFLNQLISQSLLGGSLQQGQAQGDLDRSFAEFQNRQPFSNPAFNSALGFATGFPPISGGTPGIGGSALSAGGSITAAILPALLAKSSMEFKKNIELVHDTAKQLRLVNGVNIVEFDYKDIDEKRHIGIILENEDPSFATEDGKQVDVDIIGILLGSIQELSKRVKELEDKNGTRKPRTKKPRAK